MSSKSAERIEAVVRRTRRRLWLHAAIQRTFRGAFVGSVACCAAIALARLLSPGVPLGALLAGIVGLCLVVPAVFSAFRRPSLLEAAIFTDLHNELRERLSTVIAMGEDAHPLRERLVDDAYGVLENVRRPIPFRTPLEGKLLFAPVLSAVLLFLLLPEIDVLGVQKRAEEKREEKERVRRSTGELLKKAKNLKREAVDKNFKKGLKLAREVEQVTEKFRRESAEKKKVLVELSRLSDKLRKAQRRKQYEPLKDAFRVKPKAAIEPESLSEKMLKAMEKGGTKEAAKELRKQLEKFQEKMKRNQLTDKERKEMARQMRRLQRNFEIPPDLAKKLEKLMEALEKLDTSKFQQNPKDYEDMNVDFEELLKQLEELAKKLEEKDFLEKLLKQLENAKKNMAGG
jgi:hypothetical protein